MHGGLKISLLQGFWFSCKAPSDAIWRYSYYQVVRLHFRNIHFCKMGVMIISLYWKFLLVHVLASAGFVATNMSGKCLEVPFKICRGVAHMNVETLTPAQQLGSPRLPGHRVVEIGRSFSSSSSFIMFLPLFLIVNVTM